MAPILAVFTSYPSAGKSAISAFLQKELGFKVLGYDDVREQMYGKPFADLSKEERTKIWPEINSWKITMLSTGLNVAMDSTHRSNLRRRISLDTAYRGTEIPADKYLVVLRVSRRVLESRELLRRGDLREIEYCDADWEEPEPHPQGYCVIEYVNDTPDDLRKIQNDLALKFEKSNGLWVPVKT